MVLKEKLFPNYGRRIEELRRFRDKYNSMIARVHKQEGSVRVELPSDPGKDELATLNHDLRSRLVSEEDSLTLPEDDREDLIAQMEAIADYTDQSIKMLKRKDLLYITITITFAVLGVLFLRNIPA